jgi:hypothetical protein
MKLKFFAAALFITSGIMAACNQHLAITEKGNKPMQVKVVTLEKCSATPPTIKLVKETAKELGVKIDLQHVVVKTVDEAKEHRHIGSPTVQINGIDIEPQARDITQFGIT